MATARPKGNGYEIRVSMGCDMNGKRLMKSKIWKPDKAYSPKQLEKELERQKVLFEEEVKTGNVPTSNIRFKQYSDRWLLEYGKQKLAPKTYSRYVEYLQRINQAIGHIKLQDLQPLHLNAFYRNLAENGVNKKAKRDDKGNIISNGRLSPKTIVEHHRVISKLLSTAVKWNLVKENVARRADPPKVPARDIDFLDENETREMLKALDDEPVTYRMMIMLLIYTGMRRGELFGLEWKDIDFENGYLSVVRTSQYIGNKTLITKEPKTKSSHRKMKLSNDIIKMLKSYQVWQIEQRFKACGDWNETDRLFTQWNGLPMYPDSLTKWFNGFLKRHNLRHVTLHSLRHTNATLMIAEGTDIRTVSSRLGHSNTSTTLNIYTHALKSKDEQAAEVLNDILAVAETG
ncbi:MAG: tyrosine-type recombinase/integrase [Ruminococcus sp.]|nr:tyrosine-type recombinase/integrase [Ruminococcus sp.]